MPRGRKKKRPLTPAEIAKRAEHVRALNRAAKQRERERRGPAAISESRRKQQALCFNIDHLMRWVEVDPVTGCWIWIGTYAISSGRPRPVVRAGQEGKSFADVAAYRARKKRPVPRGCWLVLKCGNVKCICPEHIVVKNPAVARAERRLLYEQQDMGRQGQQGRRAAAAG